MTNTQGCGVANGMRLGMHHMQPQVIQAMVMTGSPGEMPISRQLPITLQVSIASPPLSCLHEELLLYLMYMSRRMPLHSFLKNFDHTAAPHCLTNVDASL